ncbi:hypothetical protein C8R45DRAFT_1077585 [Mycena sanguinolenta]|nr:hypothetical protein C8R45DRAFT_1077585 [Mycena sanguinolenta]
MVPMLGLVLKSRELIEVLRVPVIKMGNRSYERRAQGAWWLRMKKDIRSDQLQLIDVSMRGFKLDGGTLLTFLLKLCRLFANVTLFAWRCLHLSRSPSLPPPCPPPPSSCLPDYYTLHSLPPPPLNAPTIICPVPLRRCKLVGGLKAGRILGATMSNETKTSRGLKDLAGPDEAIDVGDGLTGRSSMLPSRREKCPNRVLTFEEKTEEVAEAI